MGSFVAVKVTYILYGLRQTIRNHFQELAAIGSRLDYSILQSP